MLLRRQIFRHQDTYFFSRRQFFVHQDTCVSFSRHMQVFSRDFFFDSQQDTYEIFKTPFQDTFFFSRDLFAMS